MGYKVSPTDYSVLEQKIGKRAAADMARRQGWEVMLPEGGFTPIGAMGGGTNVEDDEYYQDGTADTADEDTAYPATGGGLGAPSAYNAYIAAQKRVDDQIKSNIDLLTAAQNRLRDRRVGPSKAEKWFSIAAALGQPTRTGSFGESLGNLGTVLAEQNALKRKAQEERDALLEQYGLKIGSEQLRMLQSGATQAGQIYRAERAAEAAERKAAQPKYRLTSTDEWTVEPGSGGMPPVNGKGQFVVSTREQAANVPRGKEFVFAGDDTGKVYYGQ